MGTRRSPGRTGWPVHLLCEDGAYYYRYSVGNVRKRVRLSRDRMAAIAMAFALNAMAHAERLAALAQLRELL